MIVELMGLVNWAMVHNCDNVEKIYDRVDSAHLILESRCGFYKFHFECFSNVVV